MENSEISHAEELATLIVFCEQSYLRETIPMLQHLINHIKLRFHIKTPTGITYPPEVLRFEQTIKKSIARIQEGPKREE